MDRFNRYLIIYAVANEMISITRIIHGARDPKLRDANPS